MFNIQKVKDNVVNMGINVYVKNFVSSTNDFINYQYIRDLAPVVVLTNNQRRPRGRRGALWVNYNLHSFSFTLCIKLNEEIINNQNLSQIIGLAIIESCQEFDIYNLKLKHPNDILKNGKKVGGILIENIIFDSKNIYSAIGVGLNISMPGQLLSSIDGNPGNLEISKKQVEDLAPVILGKIIDYIFSLDENKEEFLEKINSLAP